MDGLLTSIYKIAEATRERSKKNNPLSTSTQQSQPAPVYEDLDLQHTSKPDNREKTFQLKENIANGPVRSTEIHNWTTQNKYCMFMSRDIKTDVF